MVVFVLRRLCWLPEQRLRSQATARDMNTLILTQLTLMTSQLGILIFYPARTARGQAGPQNEWCNTVRVSRVTVTWLSWQPGHWRTATGLCTLNTLTLTTLGTGTRRLLHQGTCVVQFWHQRTLLHTYTLYTIFHLFHTSNLRLSAQSSLTGCTQSGHQWKSFWM